MGFNIDKISGINSIYKNQKVEPKKGAQEMSQVKGKKDELQISKEAMDFQLVMKAARQAKNLPDIREEVIAPLKEKIDNGTYEVESENIAAKMLSQKLNIKI